MTTGAPEVHAVPRWHWLGPASRAGAGVAFLLALLLTMAVLQLAQGDAVPVEVQAGACVIQSGERRVDLDPCTQTLTPEPNGHLHDRILVRVKDDGGAQTRQLWLADTTAALSIRVELRQPGGQLPQVPLSLAKTDPFDLRQEASPRVAVAIPLAPGVNQLDIFYQYRSKRGQADQLSNPADVLQRFHLDRALPARLYSLAGWQAHQRSETLGLGLLLGIMLALCGVALVMGWIGTRRAYLWYALLVASHAAWLLSMGGYGFAMLWPQRPMWNFYSDGLISSVLVIWHMLFVIEFLQLRSRYPVLWRLHLIGMSVPIGNMAVAMVAHEWLPLSTLMMGLAYVPLVVVTGWRALRDRVVGTELNLMGQVWMIVFHPTLFGVSSLGFNPWPGVDYFLYPRIGVTLEMAFSAAALVVQAWHFRVRQRELRQQQWAEMQALLASEQQRLAAQEQVQQKRLELASTGHDLAQPLASLRLVAETLRAQPDSAQAVAALVERTVEHAQALLRDLIQRERGEHLLGSSNTAVLLGDVLAQVATELSGPARAKGVRLKWVDSGAVVRSSPALLMRVVRNLASNAVRYTTPRGRVLLGVRRRKDGVELQVLDTGPGLPPDRVQALQEPFRQGENASAEGYGLGLYIVRSLCHEAGWHLRVQTRTGRGTCIAVWIPTRSS